MKLWYSGKISFSYKRPFHQRSVHTLCIYIYRTWLAEPGSTGKGVQTALRIGYRHIDCASRYLNEPEIGQALAKTFQQNRDITRPQVFLTGKLWTQDFSRVRESCEQTLKDLQVDYLDQYLIHHPVGIKDECETFFPEKGSDLIPWEANRFQVR